MSNYCFSGKWEDLSDIEKAEQDGKKAFDRMHEDEWADINSFYASDINDECLTPIEEEEFEE